MSSAANQTVQPTSRHNVGHVGLHRSFIADVFWRTFHWGPLMAMSIIKFITFTTIYVTGLWWPPNSSVLAGISHVIYLCLVGLVLYHFLSSMYIGPGYVPLGWRPPQEWNVVSPHELLQWCASCEGFKAPRSHHCRKCGRCVLKMDHHCPWINNCTGYRNQTNFVLFLLFAVLGSIHASVLQCTAVYYYYVLPIYYRVPGRSIFTVTSLLCTIFSIGLSIGVIVAVGTLLYFQLKIAVRNMTGIEEWIVQKAILLRKFSEESLGPFVYPYDLGWKANLAQLFYSSSYLSLDGLNWPVCDGCNQFTLSVEQIMQKERKRIKSRLYHVTKPYNGRWFPCFSQGFKVCMSFPLTDEPRLILEVGDRVIVTRAKKRWMYGERLPKRSGTGSGTANQGSRGHSRNNSSSFGIHSDPSMSRPSSPSSLNTVNERGWFPIQCVVEVLSAANAKKYS